MTGTDRWQGFAQRIVEWQKVHGRNDLPWQNTTDPYRVWLSEIMLQQTQVATVRSYFARFLERFPNVARLADASLDDVLALWSGLGYYSRARNLHQCARAIVSSHGGVFPQTAQVLQELPGIGPSTAAAISSLCFGESVAILDANVKRVLTRVLGFDADLALGASQKALWSAATGMLPTGTKAHQMMPRYTQGMMDLGASLCSVKTPKCDACPVNSLCVALANGDAERYPVRSRKLKRTSQSLWLLWVQTAAGDVYLSQRPTPGVWAGLYCLPLFDSETALLAAVPADVRAAVQWQPMFTHVLTHKDLYLHPCRLVVPDSLQNWGDEGRWISVSDLGDVGLPAPIRKLLTRD